MTLIAPQHAPAQFSEVSADMTVAAMTEVTNFSRSGLDHIARQAVHGTVGTVDPTSVLDHQARQVIIGEVGRARREQTHHISPTVTGLLTVLHEATDGQADKKEIWPDAREIVWEWQFPLVERGFDIAKVSEAHKRDITSHIGTWAKLFTRIEPQYVSQTVSRLEQYRRNTMDRNRGLGPDITLKTLQHITLGHELDLTEGFGGRMTRQFQGSFALGQFATEETLQTLQIAHEAATKPRDAYTVWYNSANDSARQGNKDV